MSEFNRHNEQHVAERKREVVDISMQVLNGTMGIIEASRELYTLMHDLEFLGDMEDWNSIIELYSDSDYLPVDENIRSRWAQEALDKMDKEIESFEQRYKQDFQQACRKLIARFSG